VVNLPQEIPPADIAVIGGSSTYSIAFPEAISREGVEVLAEGLVFETPFGPGPPLKLFTASGRRVLTVRMHGWRRGVSRASASQQLFWLLSQAGVKEVLAEGGVGAVNHLLNLRDIMVVSDYLDFSLRKDVSLGTPFLSSMRQPVCPRLAGSLAQAAGGAKRLFDRGVYAVTDGRHFESRAEVKMLAQLGADVVGQSMCPEVYLTREIGACYARVDQVVNYAEGVIADWQHEDLEDIFYEEALLLARILLDAVNLPPQGDPCHCRDLRFPSLLTGV